MAAGSAAVLTNFLTNLYMCLGCFAAFSILRVRPWSKRFFASRRYAKDIDLKPRRLPNGLLSWLLPIINYPEPDIIDEAGLDCAMYLRILRFGMYQALFTTIWCILLVLPSNMTSSEINNLMNQQSASNSTAIVGSHSTAVVFLNSAAGVGLGLSSIVLGGSHSAVLTVNATEYKFMNCLQWAVVNGNQYTFTDCSLTGGNLTVATDGSEYTFGNCSLSGANSTLVNGTEYTFASCALTSTKSTAEGSSSEYKFTDFDRYSIANVSPGSPKMWAHMVAIYGVVIFTLWQLWRFNQQSVLLRLQFLGNAKRGGPSHTVLVTDIPAVSGAVSKALKEERRDRSLKRNESGATAASGSAGGTEQRNGVSFKAAQSDVEILMGDQSDASAQPQAPPASADVVPPGQVPQPEKEKAGDKVLGSTGQSSSSSGTPTAMQSAAAVSCNAASSAANTPKAGPGPTLPVAVAKIASSDSDESRLRSGSSLRKRGGTSYRLVADVDPQYAATGGKLEQQQIGISKEEILQQLNVVEDDVLQSLLPGLGVDTRPLPPNRRTGKRFAYDLKSDLMDPVVAAKKLLKSGLTPQQLVAREFASVYSPDMVAAVNMIFDTKGLEPVVAEYNKVAQDLEDYLEMAKLRLKLRKALPQRQMRILCMRYEKDWDYVKKFNTKWFAKVDAVEFWLERLKYLRERIKTEQAIAARKIAPSAFVTFNTRMAQAVGANSLHSHEENAWRVQNAPAPFEVVWGSLSMTTPIKSGRLYLLWAAFWAMTLFFMIPVTAIQALIEVPKLASIPVLGDIVTAPGVRQIMEAIVPGLALKIFLALVPIILRFMALLSGSTSASEIDFGVVKRFFLFQVIVVFFGSIIAGSFFNQLTQWAKNPAGVIPTLGKSIPMTSTFFITYLLITGLGVKSLQFIRLPAFVIFWLLSRFAGSPRARQRIWMYQYTNNGTTVVDHTIALLIGTTFSCINPIVCPVMLAYFSVNYVGETYNNVYVFRREYESAGRLWKTVYNQVMAGLYIMQLTMFGLLSIKRFPFSPLLIPLILFSVASHVSTLKLYRRPWSVTALHDAAEMDLLESDERRMTLLEGAKEERKKKRDKARRLQEEAAARKAEADGPSQQNAVETRQEEQAQPGKAEKLLMETLGGNGFAMNSEEKKEIVEMYRNPAFKVELEDLERLDKLGADVQERLPRLNAWVEAYEQYQREAKKRGAGSEPLPPPKMPEDLTIFDEDPNLMDSDDEGATEGESGGKAGETKGGDGKV